MRRLRRRFQSAGGEQLEARILPAGNVLASFKAGKLMIKGDQQANCVTIKPEVGNRFEVAGCAVSTLDTTTINGQSDVTFNGSIGRMTVNMRAGNDELDVSEDLASNLVINMGSGNDVLSYSGQVGGNAKIVRGSGVDQFDLQGGSVNGSLSVKTGSGSDSVAEEVTLKCLTVRGRLTFRGGGGAQNLDVFNMDVDGDARFSFGGGNDLFELAQAVFDGRFSANGGGGSLDVFDTGLGNDGFTGKGFEILL